jgi:subtilisin family serine protease
MQTPELAGDFVAAVSPGEWDEVTAAISAMGGAVVRAHRDAGVLIMRGLSDSAAESLGAMDGVRAIGADIMIQAAPELGTPLTETMDPAAHDPSQAGFYQAGYQWDMEVIGADDAWAGGATGEGVTVAILDSGIDPYHPDMAGLIDASRSVAFVPYIGPPAPPWADDNFHGTHVAGTVVTNGIGTSGVAPHTTLMAVKVCFYTGGCPFSAILSGIVHAADNDADVINMSLGGFLDKSSSAALHSILNRVVNYAGRNGVVVVSSAGNSGFDLDHLGRDFDAGSFEATPCENGNGMCISATNRDDELAGYSNYGRSAVSIAAPGGEGGFFTGVLSPCSSTSVVIPICQSGNYWLWLSGTSMAAPHVAGAAALLAGQGYRANRIKTLLQQTADDLGRKGADALYSKGRLNVFEAWSN